MSFDVTLFVRDVQGSLVAVRGGLGGELFAGNYTLRDATTTASASLTGGTPTVLQAADGRFMDLVEITLSNSSDAAVSVILSDDGTTVRTYPVAASSTLQLQYDTPIPQSAKGGAWRLDMPDISGTTVTAGALFRRN